MKETVEKKEERRKQFKRVKENSIRRGLYRLASTKKTIFYQGRRWFFDRKINRLIDCENSRTFIRL